MNPDKAKKYYQIEFVIMIGLLLIGCLFFCGIALGEHENFKWMMLRNGYGNLVGGIICLIAGFAVGKLYWRHKDIASYDEFGVRKNEKRRMEMDSKERRQLEMQSLMELEKVLPRNTIEKITKEGSVDPDRDLEKLVGITSVKNRLLEMKARMEFEEKDKKRNKGRSLSGQEQEGHHMVFYGNPGTGKTTVARIVTGILYDYEYIDKNKVIEVDGNFLKSSDPSMTETKVRFVCKAAYDGVLFIDEAYALGDDEIGQIAIATLIKEMEDHRDRLVVILAGYSEPMSKMLSINPGFKSRIKEYLVFNDYSQPELFEIFKRMAREKGFEVDGKCERPLTLRLGVERALSSWGNARTVRNVLEETIDKHALRFVKGEISPEYKHTLLEEDVSVEAKSLL